MTIRWRRNCNIRYKIVVTVPKIHVFFSYKLSDSGEYEVPLVPNKQNSIEYINTMPISPNPEVFGLHENADISKNNKETNAVRITIYGYNSNSN